MIKSKRLFHLLKLSSLFSFFTYTFSVLMLMIITPLTNLLVQTFLIDFASLINLIVNTFFTIMRLFSGAFFIGALIGLFIVFYLDFVKEQYVQ